MPELPEVEYAAAIARQALVGRTIVRARALHAAQRKRFDDRDSATLAGERVVGVRRRGKHQLIDLESGRVIHVHFRMNGDWVVVLPGASVPNYARAVFELDDGSSVVLDDSRALSTLSLHAPASDPLPSLGPEATSPEFSAAWLQNIFASRRTPIKVALLDQRIVAGIGNIYAAEALWFARIDPRRPVNRLRPMQLTAIVKGVRSAMAKAIRRHQRYYGSEQTDGARDSQRFNVYDREGAPCRRCGAPIRRITQAGRSTYCCRSCQR